MHFLHFLYWIDLCCDFDYLDCYFDYLDWAAGWRAPIYIYIYMFLICMFTYIYRHDLMPVAGSHMLEEKVSRFSELFRIRILRNFFKFKPVISWKGQNSFQRIIPSNSKHFTTLQPRGLFFVRFFCEKSRSNIWGIYESTPQPQRMNTTKRMSRDLRFPRFEIPQEKFVEWRLFSPEQIWSCDRRETHNTKGATAPLLLSSKNSCMKRYLYIYVTQQPDDERPL